MGLLNVVIWMNILYHHQIAFFKEIFFQKNDIQVIYYDKVLLAREKLGWNTKFDLYEFEKFIEKLNQQEILELVLSLKENPYCPRIF